MNYFFMSNVIDQSELNIRRIMKAAEQKQKETEDAVQNISTDISDVLSKDKMLGYVLFQYKEMCKDYFGKSVFQIAIDELQFEDITISLDRKRVDIYFRSMDVTKTIMVDLLSYDDKLLLNLVEGN